MSDGMTFEDAIKLLKNHYKWRVTATGSNPWGGKFALIVEDEQMHQFSENQILTMAADIHQEDLFGGCE